MEANRNVEEDANDSVIFADILQTSQSSAPTRPSIPKKRVLGDIEFDEPKVKPKVIRRKREQANEIDIDAMMRATEGDIDDVMSDKENESIAASSKNRKRKGKAASSKSTKLPRNDKKITSSAKGQKKGKKVSKTKKKNESDWSDSSADERGAKSKTKKRDETKKEDEEENESDVKVQGKYLDDGTLQIEVQTAKPAWKERSSKGKLLWKDDPDEWERRNEQAIIRSIINKEKTLITQFGHKLHLLAHIWLGLEWDKLCECPLLRGKIFSILPLTTKTITEKTLKSFLTELNQRLHFQTTKQDSGFPSPIGGLLMLDRAVDVSENIKSKTEWFKNKHGTFQYFIRNALLVAAVRAYGSIARLVLNIQVIPHKPQSKNQIETTKKKNVSKAKDLTSNDSVIVNCWCEIYLNKKWIPISIRANQYSQFETKDIEQQLAWPLSYCLAFDGGVRDVTARYASQWLTETKKLRIKYVQKDINWWKETCEIWPSRHKDLEETENKELHNKLKQQGMHRVRSFIYALK